MDQGRIRLVLGSILFVLLAIGLILFAIFTVNVVRTVGKFEDLSSVPKANFDKGSKGNQTETGSHHDEHENLKHGLAVATTITATITTTTAITTVQTTPVPEYFILLNNGTGSASGKVYIEYGERRGFVCNDDFDDKDALVICREIGYKNGFSYNLLQQFCLEGGYSFTCSGFESERVVQLATQFLRSSRVIFWNITIPSGYKRYTRDTPILSRLQCTGNETYLYQCPNFNLDGNTTDSCNSFAAVLCYDDIPYKFRFINSLAPDSGQIEMFVDGQWGTFCAIQSFDDTIADLICRAMNYASGVALRRGKGGPASRVPIWVPWISCHNHEAPKSLFDCDLVLHTQNIPYDYYTPWNNRYRNMYYACIDKNAPFAPAVHCFRA